MKKALLGSFDLPWEMGVLKQLFYGAGLKHFFGGQLIHQGGGLVETGEGGLKQRGEESGLFEKVVG